MPLAEYLARVSAREHRVWLAWLQLEREEECRHPTLTQWHLLALIAEVRSLFRKQRIQPADCKLRFEGPAAPEVARPPEEALALSKAAWGVPLRLLKEESRRGHRGRA